MDKEFNVLDMVDQYAEENDVDASDIFKKPEETPAEENITPPKKEKKEWKPDVSDMPEFTSTGVIYNKEDVHMEEDTELRNIMDDEVTENSKGEFDDLTRKEKNIEEAKIRHGIVKLKIPAGPEQLNFLVAAGIPNHDEAQAALDTLFDELVQIHPEFVLEWAEGHDPNNVAPTEEPEVSVEEATPSGEEEKTYTPINKINPDELGIDETKIIIDKRNVSQISWSEEEVEKIKKSRTVELNIVEGNDIEFGSVKNVFGNAVDTLLSKYQRKANDVTGVLPASKYRATFTGLSYPEVVDLSTSNEMNNIDGEYKKWTICFSHIRNQSCGPWEEYSEYIDPETNAIVRVQVGSDIPSNIDKDSVKVVTKFEDFMRKTSYLDLNYMLWRILCATTLDHEIVSIDCHSTFNGKPCNNTYDWIYNPNELLVVDEMNPAVLEDMKAVGEASSTERIMELFNSSPVNSRDYVKLSSSGFIIVYGHANGRVYLDEIYGRIEELENNAESDPTVISKIMKYDALTVVKEVMIPTDNGYSRITEIEDILKVLEFLDEVDWKTITELKDMMTKPYQLKFIMKDIVCPKCKNRSAITIDNMSRMLFIVARSLSSVQVTLKRD